MPVPEHHNLKSAAVVRLDIEANAVVDARLLDDNEGIVPSRCSSCGGRGTHVANCSVASRRSKLARCLSYSDNGRLTITLRSTPVCRCRDANHALSWASYRRADALPVPHCHHYLSAIRLVCQWRSNACCDLASSCFHIVVQHPDGANVQ